MAEVNISTEKKGKILSFHPLVDGDFNFWAFSAVEKSLLEAFSLAKVVVFPQVFPEVLFRYAQRRGLFFFPDYRVRFDFPGKDGQFFLWQALGLPSPETVFVPKLAAFGDHPNSTSLSLPSFPFVVKTTDEHEGQGVFLVEDEASWKKALSYLKARERAGRFGFLLQEYLPSPYDLRVVVIGRELIPCWRKKEEGFKSNLAQGGEIIPCPDRRLEAEALALASRLVSETGVNLVAVDFLLKEGAPVLNELNFVFGRRTLKDFDKLFLKAFEAFLKDLPPG